MSQLKTVCTTRLDYANARLTWLNSDDAKSAMSELDDEDQRRFALDIPVQYIDNESFSEDGFGASVFSEQLKLDRNATSKANGLPTNLSNLCAAKLLTRAQERMLFERMNFLLHIAENERQLAMENDPHGERQETFKRLMAIATWHRDRIVEANTRLVFSIIRRFVNSQVTFDDLLGDGMLALIRAVEKFDYAREFRFSTYATQVVRRNAYRMVVDNQTEKARVVNGVDGLELDQENATQKSSMSSQRWHLLQGHLANYLNQLDKREKLIIRARFSLGSHRRVHTLQSIANRLGVSKERVRQIEKRSVEKLQQMASQSQSSAL